MVITLHHIKQAPGHLQSFSSNNSTCSTYTKNAVITDILYIGEFFNIKDKESEFPTYLLHFYII